MSSFSGWFKKKRQGSPVQIPQEETSDWLVTFFSSFWKCKNLPDDYPGSLTGINAFLFWKV
jgi:hypothetical protein